MGKLSNISGQDVITTLERMGFYKARQRGSHVIMKKDLPDGSIGCVVPMHREIAYGTLRNILQQARISMDEFVRQIR